MQSIGQCMKAVVVPLTMVLTMAGCMGRGEDAAATGAQVGRATMMPQGTLAMMAGAGRAQPQVATPIMAESCVAGEWRSRLLDRRDGVLARADLPPGHRVLHPGDLVTAEVNERRMTVTVNGKGRIDNVYCG